MSEGKQREGKHKKVSTTGIVEAIRSNTRIAALAMKGAKTWQRIVVYVCYGLVLLGIILLSTPPYETPKQLAALPWIIVPLCIVLVLMLRYGTLSRVPPTTQRTETTTPQWEPLAAYKLERLRIMLEDTREVVVNFLKSKEPVLSDNDVRANVFYPKYDCPHKPGKYTLEIYPGLHFKMENEEELHITFKPKQGATGKVFVSGQACVAKRLPSDTGGWDSTFNITESLARIVHPDLKWIISMPLKTEGSKPVGVMNVDGLSYDFSTDVLNDCMIRLLTQNVVIMSQILISS